MPSRFRLGVGRQVRVALVCAIALGALLATSSPAAAEANAARFLVKFKAGASASTRAAVLASAGAREQRLIAGIGVRVVTVPAGSAASALGKLRGSRDVAFAEADATATATDVPNDPSFSLQWGLKKIKAPEAWTTNTGSASVKVAVLDTGVSLAHPDLQGKIVLSKNLSSSSTADDVNDHGSHVAGIAASTTNNGVGVAGVGYTVSIMNVKVLGDSGSGLYSDVATGITWAADNGANVINLSLGGTMASSTLEAAVNYAWSKGVVVVAAAGNNSSSSPFYPASYDNVVAVAATTDLDKLASFSNYGTWVDVAAPGISVYSTIPGGYGYMSGTSMASPFVSGLAALLFAQVTDTNGNGLRNDEVRSRIQSTADNVGLSGIGSGRINAYRAVTGGSSPTSPPANTSPPAVSGTLAVGQTLSGSTGSWTNNPTGYAYEWQRCDSAGAACAPVSGATVSSYTLGLADVGSTVRVRVTASNSAGSASATSAQTAVVAGAQPANTALPAVSGTTEDGRTLQTTDGTWSNNPTSYARQWLRCDAAGANCTTISGATAVTYALVSADVGSTIRSRVTATNAAGSMSAQSAQTGVVVATRPVNTSVPVLSGTPRPGQTLTSSAGSWTGTAPLGYVYQWLRCDASGAGCVSISGATGSSYTLASIDLGSTLRARVQASNAAGSTQASSLQTAAVSNLQTLTFTGTLTNKVTSLSFPVTFGAGTADATLTFSKAANVTLKLVDAGGTTVGQITATSPLRLQLSGLAAGSYTYVVSGSGYKGSLPITLAVTAAAP
jgi:thermitase